MPYVFSETQQGESRPGTTFPSLTSEVLEETFAQTFEENPIAAIGRARELRQDYRTGPTISADSARSQLADRGLSEHLKVSDAGITQAALDTLMFRKRIELKRQEVFQQARGGAGETGAKLGVALATSLIDPVSVATAFIPAVGEARYAGLLARAGSGIARTGVRLGVGAAEGVIGAAVLEPIIAGSRRYEQADYDMSDSMLNVAFGGLFGAGLHSVGGAVSDGIRAFHGEDSTAFYRARELSGERPARIEPTVDGEARAAAPSVEPVVDRVQENQLPGSAAQRVADVSPIVRQEALTQAVVNAVMDEPVRVDGIVVRGQLPQTETPSFKRWFGESKVTDADGSPKRVFRGERANEYTPDPFLTFDEPGLWYTSDATAANAYAQSEVAGTKNAFAYQDGAKVIPAFISMKNPLIVDAAGANYTDIPFRGELHITEGLREIAAKEGHDGLIVRNVRDGSSNAIDVYRPLRPEQIKSAIGNSGRFDADSKSLTDDSSFYEDTSELPALIEHAEEVIARETDSGTPTADMLTMATEEADLATADLQSIADRLGVEAEDADMKAVNEAAKLSERWAKAAQLATVCLMRGG